MRDTITQWSITRALNIFAEVSESPTLVATLLGQIASQNGVERRIVTPLYYEGTEHIDTAVFIFPRGTSILLSDRLQTSDSRVWKIVTVKETTLAVECIVKSSPEFTI